MSQWGGSRAGAGRKKGSSKQDNSKHSVKSGLRGGARPGAGAKAKYGEPTKAMRIPASMQESIVHYIENKGFNLPVYAMQVPMGPAQEAIGDIDRMLNLNELIRHPQKTYFHPVKGDSMEPTIAAGDLAVIDTSLEPMHDDVVLAFIEGGLTLKRLVRMNGRTWLESDNTKYDPIILNPNTENMVCGVMTYSIRPVSTKHTQQF